MRPVNAAMLDEGFHFDVHPRVRQLVSPLSLNLHQRCANDRLLHFRCTSVPPLVRAVLR